MQYVRHSLTKLTTAAVMTMAVLAQSLIAEAQAAEPDITRDVMTLEVNGAYQNVKAFHHSTYDVSLKIFFFLTY